MKNINIIAFGSTGDVLPHIALGTALKERGYNIKVTTHINYKKLVTESGLEFHAVNLDAQKLLEMTLGREWIKSGNSVLGFIGSIKKVMEPFLDIMTSDAEKGAEGADLIIFSTLADCGQHIAEKMRIPCIGSVMQPLVATTEYTCPMWPELPFRFPLYNKFSFKFSEMLMWKTFEKPAEMWRVKHLKLNRIGMLGPYRKQEKRRMHFLVAVSPTVLQRPKDWPEFIHLTGYWFNDDNSSDPELESFANSGSRPLYIGFGSMTMFEEERKGLASMLNDILHKNKIRAIIQSGWSGFGEGIDADIIVRKHVNHSKILPSCAAAMHHCGAGTTAAVLRAGIPSIACPMFADQFFWADRIENLDAGLRLDFDRITKGKLEKVITEVMEDKHIRNNAEKAARKIEREDGKHRAAGIIDKYIRKYYR